MTEEIKEIPHEKRWKKFLKSHWKITLVVVAGLACAVTGSVLVFLWRTISPEAASRYPATLALWTVGYAWMLFWDIVLWEFLLVLLPVIVAAVIIFTLWWKKMPADEKHDYFPGFGEKKRHRRGPRGRGRNMLNFFVTITWLIIVYINGYWNTPFASWTFAFLITTLVWAFAWDLIVLGIPAAIGLAVWLRRKMRE